MPNIFQPEWEAELQSGDMILRAVRVGAAAGARALGATLYELEPGAAVSPLHVHHANGELLVVIAGRPTLRDAEGELRSARASSWRSPPAGRAPIRS
jgi:uncharacterized cupin superfamily protein